MSAEPNYRRTKPGMRTCIPTANGASGPSSQIPGLSQTANDAPEEKTKGRRVGIQASDSDYVKLAKQGGHRGLLSHDDVEDAESKSSNSMKRPEWLPGTDGQQSQGKASTQRLVAPFGTDDSSAWDIESDGAGANKTKVSKISPVAKDFEKLALSPEEIEEACKYKRLSHDKKEAAPVSMSKLLSFGYMEDEKKSPEDDASSMTSEQTSTIAPEDELE